MIGPLDRANCVSCTETDVILCETPHAAVLLARKIINGHPASGYMTILENWRQPPEVKIEFTMRRLPTAD
jgi:hypothetical protein